MAPSLVLAAETSPPALSLRPQVARALRAAQSEVRAHHWRQAGASLEATDALDLNALERYRVDEFKAYVLYKENHLDAAAKRYAALLEDPYTTPKEQRQRTKSVAEMYFRAADYQRAADWARRYLDRYRSDIPVAEVLADAELRLKDYRQSASAMQKVIDGAESSGRIPQESWLRIAANAHYGMGDEAGEDRMLQQLARYYDRPEDWRALLQLRIHNTKDARLAYAYMRLAFDLKVLEGPDEYENLVLESLRRGLPKRAEAALARAKARKVFPDERSARLAAMIAAKAGAAPAPGTNGAERDANQGRLYLSEGRDGAASTSLAAALHEGGLERPDEIRIDLGISYLRDRKIDAARQAFNEVPAASPWQAVSSLWELRATAQSPRSLS
jgi:hypothetical protein